MRLAIHMITSSLRLLWLRMERDSLLAHKRYWQHAMVRAPKHIAILNTELAAIDAQIKRAQTCAR